MLTLAGLFYWFNWKPEDIRKHCVAYATQENSNVITANNRYRKCLAERGLKPESLFDERDTTPRTQELNTSPLEDKINELQDSLENSQEEQKSQIQDEFQNSANCESNGGRYQGNGLCVYY